MSQTKKLSILGTRGIPSAHGGFETFAERLALALVSRGWQVAVYCQHADPAGGERLWRDSWQGVERINIAVGPDTPKSTLLFDWLCVRHAAERVDVCLVLGYNGAAFLPWLRLRGRKVITNMDGIEWRRPKWGAVARAWFRVNEWIAARTSHRLVADHPEIARHLRQRHAGASIATVPYGADPVLDAPEAPVRALGLVPDGYLISVCRIEPDNNVLLIVKAFSAAPRGLKLVVLGDLDRAGDYGRAIRAAAGDDVLFPGAIFDAMIVGSLRFHARAYMHGHTVGGTNPSLVEALWAGNAVIAHDNPFNRWTAADAAVFFRDGEDCAARIAAVAQQPELVTELRRNARSRAAALFEWQAVFSAYEQEFLLLAEREEGARDRAPGLQRTRG